MVHGIVMKALVYPGALANSIGVLFMLKEAPEEPWNTYPM